MPTIIVGEPPDTDDARVLITELESYLTPLYPTESNHGYTVEKLLHDDAPFFVMGYDGVAAGCSGIKLFSI